MCAKDSRDGPVIRECGLGQFPLPVPCQPLVFLSHHTCEQWKLISRQKLLGFCKESFKPIHILTRNLEQGHSPRGLLHPVPFVTHGSQLTQLHFAEEAAEAQLPLPSYNPESRSRRTSAPISVLPSNPTSVPCSIWTCVFRNFPVKIHK